MDLISLCDGENTLLQIAETLKTPIWELYELIDKLVEHKLLQANEWSFDNQKQSSSSFLKFLQEHIEKINPRRNLTTEEAKCLAKLEAISDKLKRGEYVQSD